MKRKLSGMLSLFFAAMLSFAAVAKAEETVKQNDVTKADEVKHYRIGLRALYVFPTESFDKQAEKDIGKLSLSKNFTPCADLEYFFTDKFSAELIAGVTKHDIKLNGNSVGSTYLLPPSITLKYHPFGDAKFSPYVGAGIEMTFPFNDKMNDGTPIRIDASIGYALQTGIDIKVDNHLYLNLDYKYLNADTRFRLGGPDKAWYSLDMNPHVFGVGVGYRF